MKRLTVLAPAALLAMSMSGCSTDDVLPPLVEDPGSFVSHDDLLAQVAVEVAGFGGMFLDDSGALNVYLRASEPSTQAPSSEEIKTALTRVFGEDILTTMRHEEGAPSQMVSADLKVIQGQFDVPTLLEARGYADTTLALPGVVFTDLDEARNRVLVGVENDAARQQVEQALEKLGVSPGMIIIEETEPIMPLSVTQQFRPTLGGIQIQADIGGPCTLGFNATRNGVRGFVTNSHCTNVQGGTEGTVFFQEDDFPADNYIGDEIADPPYYTGGWPFTCMPSRRCRFSDSAFVQYAANVPSQIARIARTEPNSILIDASNPTFQIVSKTAWPVVGLILHKVGMSTGWTSGVVNNTCLTHTQGNPFDGIPGDVMLICQNRLSAFDVFPLGASGDSGAPVFRLLGGNNVSLYGIHHGATPGGMTSFFSPMQSIEGELGVLTTTPAELPLIAFERD